VELESGQTFAVAGLVQQRVQATTDKTPVLGDLPIVGWAFQNKRYQQLDTELLIMVTPHLAEAMDERPCKLPGRESRIPNDVEWYLGSRFEPPCFNDPYKNHYQNHHAKIKPPHPTAVPPYDNRGMPQYDVFKVESPVTIPAQPAQPAATPAEGAPAPAPADELKPAPIAPPAAPVEAPPAPSAFTMPPAGKSIPELDEEISSDGVVPPPPPVTSTSRSSSAKIVSVQAGAYADGEVQPATGCDGWVRANRRRGGGMIRQASAESESPQ
jgi:pilus assembly protein CpaC